MDFYNCKICNKKHDVFFSMICPEPDLISNMSEEDKAKRIIRDGSLVIVDRENVFINGIIFIELKKASEWLSWEVWVKIEKEEFLKQAAIVEKGGKVPFLLGTLESELPLYQASKNLKVQVDLYTSVDKTVVTVIEQNHPLTKDQKDGIGEEMLIELMERIYHNPKSQKKKKNKEPFEILLLKALEKAESEFIEKGKKIGIDIVAENQIVFQIISNKLLEKQQTKENGFGLDLSFDQSFAEQREEILRFKESRYYQEFNSHLLNEIPTYQKDLGTDKEEISSHIKGLLKEVYIVKKEQVSFDVFEIEK